MDTYTTGEAQGRHRQRAIPKVGQPLVIIRDNRNGVKCDGIMRTSPLVEISQHEDGVSQILETQNSIYILKPL